MKIIKVRDIKESGYVGKQYFTDDPLDIDTIILILSSYENESRPFYMNANAVHLMRTEDREGTALNE